MGNAYVDREKGMFFGPGVNKAYQLESQAAVYPRIVVDYASCKEGICGKVTEENVIEEDTDGNIFPWFCSALVLAAPK